jgi:hypothetical protein
MDAPPPSYDHAVRSRGAAKPERVADVELGQIPSPQTARAPTARSPPPRLIEAEIKWRVAIALVLLTLAWCAGIPFGSKATNLLKRDCACSAEWPMRRRWDFDTHPACVNSTDTPDARSCCVKRGSGEKPKGLCRADDYARFQEDGGIITAERYYVAGALIVILVAIGTAALAAWFAHRRRDLRQSDDNDAGIILVVLSCLVGTMGICIALAALFNLAGLEVKWGHFALAIYWILTISTEIALFALLISALEYPQN